MIKKITLWLTVLLVFLFAAAVQVEAAIPTHERDALTALYNATNGDGWNNNTNWKNNNNDVDGFSQFGSEGSWHGITVSGDHVVEIVLSSNRLEGNLPAALGALSHLRKLELRLNRLSGSIPTALADLNRLTYLNLGGNSLEGNIPVELSNLVNLTYLNLGGNHLNGPIPQDFGYLVNLEYLHLGGNNLSGSITKKLGYLDNLRYLNLEKNGFSGSIPPALGSLVKLEALYLRHNRLQREVPAKLGDLVNLKKFYINGNHLICNLPAELERLTALNPGETSINYNGFEPAQGGLASFLNGKVPGWDTTQTVAPRNISASILSDTSVRISWTPIPYTADEGKYYIFYSTTKGGPYEYHGETATKYDSHYDAEGLTPGLTYYFVLKTRTFAHENNSNKITTDYSNEVEIKLGSSYILTVRTLPDAGAEIIVTPADMNGNGNGISNFTRDYYGGTGVTVTAPNFHNGRQFRNWMIDGEEVRTELTINVTMNSNHTVEAIYEKIKYTLEVETTPETGAFITVNPTDSNGLGDGTSNFARLYEDGTQVSVVAPTEYNGRLFSKFTIDGVNNSSNSIQVTMNQNHKVIAFYVNKEFTLEVETTPETGASITVTPTDNNGHGNGNSNFSRIYTDGTQVNVVAPSEYNGRLFQKFTIDGVNNSSNSIQVTMNQNHKVIAFYVKKEFKLYVQTLPETGASMTVVPNDNNNQGNGNSDFVRTYTDGTTVSVKAPAEHNGRVFVKFTIDGVDTTANGIQVTMNQNHTVIAHYVKKEYTLNVLTKPEEGAEMTVVPNDNNNLGNGISNFSRIYTDGTTVSVKAPAEHNGRIFSKFTIDGVDTTGNGIQVTMNQNHTVIAYYVKKEYTLNVLTKPEDGAMMTVVPKDINELGSANSNFSRVYVDGTDVTVTAPAEHNNRVFNKFTIDGVDHNEVEVRVTMNRDHTVIAYYVEKEFTLNVQTSPNTGAPITVTPTDNNNLNSAPSNFTRLYNDGTEVTVTAPASHLELEFEKWLIDGVESTELTIKVIMNTNHTVIAHYKEKPCVNTLTVKSSPTGATIEVSPADNSGAASGNAQFVRTYNCDKKVTVTAPLEFENKEFVKWLIDGNIDTNTTTRVNMNESHIVEAVYETKGCAHTLIVNCYPEPNVPVEISPSDSEGNGNGNADLERVFNCDTEVTVIAPREFEGMTFEKWIVDGSIQTDPTCKIVMSIDHVIEAVYVKSGGCEHILTVKSSPVDGIAIEVSPKDNKNKQHGYTEFKRYYSCDTEVRLVAPQNKECQDFIKWVIEETGAEYFTPEARLIMDSDYTATVYYSEAPSLALERLQLNFGSEISGPVTGAQELLIGNNGGGQLNWSVSADEEWIHFTPEAGDKSQHISVSVDPSGLPAGTYKGNLTIAGAQHESGHSVKVVLKVYEQGSKSTSFGELLTPKDKTVVRRNIPVTGWVLDEIECTSVKIFYSLFETPNSNVFLGDALFVPGARPDIEEAYPEYPKHHRSGYGFMLLTNTLPNEGNGDFYIKAVAVDITGNEVLLGTHLISVDNEHAVKPFGAIESPEKSSEISGFEYINTAWVVTYEPNMIPTDGSTIKGWIDGVPLKDHPFYNMENRTVLEKFPTVNNAEGASGYYVLDTTEYTNGSHNVTWSASDTNGNLAAVGSRYFDILNAENEIDIRSGGLPAPACTPVLSPVNFRKGYDINTAYEAVEPDSEGVITVTVKEDERLEIDLIIDEKEAQNINRYYGYMLQGGEHKILPVGSTLNGNGMFYWQPGAGFVGEYTLVFIARSSECEKSKKTIKVIIEPKF